MCGITTHYSVGNMSDCFLLGDVAGEDVGEKFESDSYPVLKKIPAVPSMTYRSGEPGGEVHSTL